MGKSLLKEINLRKMEAEQVTQSLQKVLTASIFANTIARGLNESCKALEYDHDSEDRRAVLCVLAKNCQDDGYKKLVAALCKTWKIKLMEVDSREDLGKWSGLYKTDASGTARKIRPCSCVVIRSWPKNEELKSHVNVLENSS